MNWSVRGRTLECDSSRPLIMGILNVTPDSFSDGGKYLDPAAAVEQAKKMLAEGADLIDVGGESTRPGAEPVPMEEEKSRVVPVIERIVAETKAVVSIDTMKAGVAKAALSVGAVIVNDVTALAGDPDMAAVCAKHAAGVVLMHMRGTPRTMQAKAVYGDVVADVTSELQVRGEIAVAAGIPADRIVYDPGLGFAKTAPQSLELLRRLSELNVLGRPLLVAPSRKSFIGKALSDRPPEGRLFGTAAAVALAVFGGASILRVHDVAAMADAAKTAAAVSRGLPNS